MSQKAGCSSGLDEAALKDLLRRLHAQGYREARGIQHSAQLQPKQYLRRPETAIAEGDRPAADYWQVLWRES